MPRYFFNIDGGRTAIDNEGSDLPDRPDYLQADAAFEPCIPMSGSGVLILKRAQF
jgi:hypothetical protein